jgi:hypothetical protein
LANLHDDGFAIADLALVEPDLDFASGVQGAGQVADEGLVLARMRERDADHGAAI